MIDTSDMLFAHRVFRRELSDAPELIGGVASGDTNRSALIADHLGHMVAALHHHHAAEDELPWPSLHARIPTSGLQIQQMEDDHAAIAELVESVETVRTPWGKSADSTLAAQLIAATEQLSARVDTHLEDEEQNILPLIGQITFCLADAAQVNEVWISRGIPRDGEVAAEVSVVINWQTWRLPLRPGTKA